MRTTFDSQRCGLRFRNDFRDARYAFVTLPGMCGGMTYTANDYFHAGVAAPETSVTPPISSPLGAYLQRRQLESLFCLHGGPVFAAWLAVPAVPMIGGFLRDRVPEWTLAQWPLLKTYIDANQPVPLGLLAPWTLIPQPTNCHQVLAIGYTEDRDGRTVRIWDPNRGETDLHLARGANVWAERGGETWRGWFVEKDYSPQIPPGGAS